MEKKYLVIGDWSQSNLMDMMVDICICLYMSEKHLFT